MDSFSLELKSPGLKWLSNLSLAATVLHSADHYYADKYTSFGSQSRILKFDFSLLRLGIYGLNTYRTRNVKCWQHLDDPICCAIYESAMEYDPEFAKEVDFAVASWSTNLLCNQRWRSNIYTIVLIRLSVSFIQ